MNLEGALIPYGGKEKKIEVSICCSSVLCEEELTLSTGLPRPLLCLSVVLTNLLLCPGTQRLV